MFIEMLERLRKNRPLYVALSMHPHRHHGDAFDQYHWALVVGPTIETPMSKGTRYHLTFTKQDNHWVPRIEKDHISLGLGSALIVRAKLGTLTKMQDLERIITGIPTDDLVKLTCEMWVSRVVSALHRRPGIMQKRVEEWYMIRAWTLAGAEDSGQGYKTDMGYNRIVDLSKRVRSLPDQKYFSVMPPLLSNSRTFADNITLALSMSTLSTNDVAMKPAEMWVD